VSFRGTFADTGEEISGGSSEGMEVELEEGRMIPGFVEGIVGMKMGEARTIDCTFPESYPQEEAAGRPARFELTLLELKTRELPPLDDAFARQAGDKETLAELRADLEARLQREAEQRSRSNRQDALLTALVEQLEVELPETLIQQEVRSLLEQTAGQIAQQGVDVRKVFTQDVVRNLMETSRPEAEQRLRRNLALRALAAAEKIEVGDKDVEARLEEVRRDLADEASIDPERLRQAVREDLLREALLAWLEENSTLTEKAAGTDDEPAGEKPAPKPAAKKQKEKGKDTASSGAKRSRPKADEAEKPID
jgi:trigger factor